MKAKEFEIGKGEYAVIATYLNHNDATESEESTTIRTHERPRARLYTDAATVALEVRNHFKLGDLNLIVRKLNFSENDDGQFVKISLETLEGIRVFPPRVKRLPYIAPGEDLPDPEYPLNRLLAAVDLLENRISEYLSGDREQPELPMEEPAPEVEARPSLFGFLPGGKKTKPKKATAKE